MRNCHHSANEKPPATLNSYFSPMDFHSNQPLSASSFFSIRLHSFPLFCRLAYGFAIACMLWIAILSFPNKPILMVRELVFFFQGKKGFTTCQEKKNLLIQCLFLFILLNWYIVFLFPVFLPQMDWFNSLFQHYTVAASLFHKQFHEPRTMSCLVFRISLSACFSGCLSELMPQRVTWVGCNFYNLQPNPTDSHWCVRWAPW